MKTEIVLLAPLGDLAEGDVVRVPLPQGGPPKEVTVHSLERPSTSAVLVHTDGWDIPYYGTLSKLVEAVSITRDVTTRCVECKRTQVTTVDLVPDTRETLTRINLGGMQPVLNLSMLEVEGRCPDHE